MAVGEDEPIAIFPIWSFGIVDENVEVEGSENVGHAQGAGGMTRASLDQHFNEIFADERCFFLQLHEFFIMQMEWAPNFWTL